MKVAAFLGSPGPMATRTPSPSGARGRAVRGLQHREPRLRMLHIHHCTAAATAAGRAALHLQDDAEPLYQAMIAADVLLFVTPVYW